MKFFHNINFTFLILAALVPALFSCTDELGFNNGDENLGEDFTGITLYIPNIEDAAEFGATRADGYANTRAYDTQKEGNFNTLYIAAVDESENVQTFLKTVSNGTEEGYNKYTVSLKPGNYRFYVVANLNRYTVKDGNESATFADIATTESEIRQHILNFSSSRPLEPGFLPMACLNEDIKVGESATSAVKNADKEVFVNISAGDNKKVYADLRFLCSKVRYTILFDREKSQFASGDIIDVHRNTATDAPYATNLRHQTAINSSNDAPQPKANTDFTTDFITEGADGNTTASGWPIFLDRYKYGNYEFYEDLTSNDERKKLKEELGKLVQWKSTDGEWTSGEFLNKRAWQGIAYLPENYSTSQNALNPTLLKFPYSFNGATGAESPRTIKLDWESTTNGSDSHYGLKRAKSYDVYALITTPDPAQWTLNVDVDDWTLQNLAYELHGPYELVVETTLIKTLGMVEDAVFWFRSDIPPSQIGFISPQVSATGVVDKNMVDIFTGKVVTDNQGNYVTNENGDYLFQVGINTKDLPYKVIYDLSQNGMDYKDETGEIHHYDIKDISYFHIVAGSLNKRIEIEELDIQPYLVVDPQTIIIDTREYYISGLDNPSIQITFETNVDIFDKDNKRVEGVSLTLSDPDGLIEGVGNNALKISLPNYIVKGGNDYVINQKTGAVTLNVRDIITGNSYWDQNHELTLYFTLTVNSSGEDLVIRQPVTIKVRPFSGTYVIHFRDNLKNWEDAHIYIFQDLTLPGNMTVNENGETKPYEYAGKIVGYIEENPTSGFQWNAALQYVFTNNLSFRGWYGHHIMDKDKIGKNFKDEGIFNEYGGPSLNNPWAEAYCNAWDPNGNETKLSTGTSTMGFVMFGQPDERKADQKINSDQRDRMFQFWNYDYSYNVTYLLEPNSQRQDRYNYDVNFNEDHEVNITKWGCQTCRNMQPDYNGTKDQYGNENPRFYPGISMEKEEDGWWKYTLTGVAMPGRTMIIFANWHEPWIPQHKWFDYRAEDYRWPGDYEAGLPLFDFEDNEGWFLFDGNTVNSDQKFTDNKPTNVLPYNFSSVYDNMTIEVVNPSSGSISAITANGKTSGSTSIRITDGKTINVYNFSGVGATGTTMDVKITVNGQTKTYKMAPKNFKRGGAGYITALPLLWEYTEGIDFYVKWNDQVQPNDSYWYSETQNDPDQVWRETIFYHPPKPNGSNYLNVYWGSEENWSNPMASYPFTGKEIGNYKHIEFTTKEPTGSVKDKMELRLCTTQSGDERFYKVLSVEDLPQYYYPTQNLYLINWHFLKSPYSPKTPW